MDPRSEVLLRQRHLFATPLLLAGLPADDLLAELPQAQGWSWHAGEQRSWTPASPAVAVSTRARRLAPGLRPFCSCPSPAN